MRGQRADKNSSQENIDFNCGVKQSKMSTSRRYKLGLVKLQHGVQIVQDVSHWIIQIAAHLPAKISIRKTTTF